MIELRHLTKEYPSRAGTLTALSDVSLTIEDGAVYGVIGLSGAGKSTLVRCINLLERPTSGQVFIDGEDLTAAKKKRLLKVRQSIGMIFQSFNLLEQRTVEQNVRFPLELVHAPKQEAAARAAELLSLVGIADKAKAYPAQLSGGQKQRVAIARALALRPKYLLCDEATSALDPNTTDAILELLKQINRDLGVTIIVITHEMKVVERVCTDVAVLSESKIAEAGKVEKVFSDPQSEIARERIIPELIRTVKFSGGSKLRLIFDGSTSDMPIISALALELHEAVNILYADTKNIDGKAFGHMVITLPEDPARADAVVRYLAARHISYKEEI